MQTPMARGRGHAGFTMVEMVVTIAITGIIVALAVPSFKTTLMNSRRAALINDFVASAGYARSEALNRKAPVVMCRVNNPATATDCTSSSGSGYEKGWIVATATIGTGCALSNFTVLRRGGPAAEPTATMKGNTLVASTFFFNAMGAAGVSCNASNGTFVYCDSRGFSSTLPTANVLVLSPGGRISNMASNDANASTYATSCSP